MEWISVKKKRPIIDEVVLATGLWGKMRTLPGVVKYRGRGKYESLDKNVRVCSKVTHWQPIPAPPEAP